MQLDLERKILQCTQASSIQKVELVQSLWSDFGRLERVWLKSYRQESIIIKRIAPPTKMNHPRGWNTDASAQRKLKSYKIERYWYENYVNKLPESIRVPKYLFSLEGEVENVLGMEDLQSSGFSQSYRSNKNCFDLCLEWLANFHAFHLKVHPIGLWEIGTYWHLGTRQDEWNDMESGKLKDKAPHFDKQLNDCKYQTLVHGDAKPANFCFSEDFNRVAAVDFQYVGRGCGMKDVIYLMSSAKTEDELLREDKAILSNYFNQLQKSLKEWNRDSVDFEALKEEWTALYAVAWADFVRFLKGWSPKHARLNSYASHLVQKELD
ncbi:MAG: DUF1679 domain-containing protein [bacterium]|nr:DUF1679 domain-containing protein [bacterium]